MKKGSHHSPETRAKISEAHRDRPLASAETRERLRQANLQRLANPEWRKRMQMGLYRGRHPSAETRERLRQAQLERYADPEEREKARQARAGQRCESETRERMRQAAIRRFVNPEERERMRQARLRQRFPLTDIEIILQAEFKKRRLRFEMHEPLLERFQPDFIFPGARLVVQADGYFHTWPKIRVRDAAFNETAAAAGWTVWRFSDKQIKQNPAAIGRAVAAFVRRAENAAAAPS